jgi:ketosteroid isomerase-like protein
VPDGTLPHAETTRLTVVPQTASREMLVAFRESFECWNRGEVDLMLGSYDPNAAVDVSRVLPDESVLHGHEAFAPFFHRLWDAWEGVRYDPEEVFDLGEDRFLVITRIWGRGRASGIEIDHRQGFVYSVGASGIASLVVYPSSDEALAAVSAEADILSSS